MKILERVAIACWLMGVAVVVYAAIAGPGPILAAVFVLWAPAAVWGVLRHRDELVVTLHEDKYVPIENPQTLREEMQNLDGAIGNLKRAVFRAIFPTKPDKH